MKKINELTEKEYKEFFEWLLGREVVLDKYFDFTLCSNFSEPYIYYPKEIAKFLETRPMQRLKRVGQMGVTMLSNPDVSHTRYDHCLGTYHNAVLFYILQFQNLDWRKQIELDERKIEVLANIMEALRHDDGHNILSHSLESLLGQQKGAHEILGARYKEELEETRQALNRIHPDLIEMMKKVSASDYDLISLREGNLDFDRLDFLSRDMFYNGMEDRKGLTLEILKRCRIQRIQEGDTFKEIVVYDYDALPYIEASIETRAEIYKKISVSNQRKSLDEIEKQLCETLLSSEIPEGSELRNYLLHIENSNVEDIDLEQFLSWNDLRYYNELIQIAMGDGDETVRKIAISCLPNIEGLCSLAIEMLNPKSTDPKTYTATDLEFLKNVKAIMQKDHPLHKKLLSGRTKDNVIILDANTHQEVADVLQSLRNKGLSEKELSSIITWCEKIKKYNVEEPIYIRGKNGEIFTLDEHPDLSIDLSPIYTNGALVLPDKMREMGISEESIGLIWKEFENFNSTHPKQKTQHSRRMKKFQTHKELYIPDYTPGIDEK